MAVAVGALLTLLAGADAVSGERERGTLESLLLSPASRLGLTAGKLLAALSLWAAAFAITLPYVWFLGRGVGIVGDSVVTGAVVGTLLAVFLASLGVLISVFSVSNRVSLSGQPVRTARVVRADTSSRRARRRAGSARLLRLDPITAGEHYVGRIVVDGRGWSEDVSGFCPRRSPRSYSPPPPRSGIAPATRRRVGR